MNNIDKLKLVNKKLKSLNDSVLKNKKWKLAFSNKGVNNYCICIIKNKKELFSGSFATYQSVNSCLDLLETMFSYAINDIKEKEVKK